MPQLASEVGRLTSSATAQLSRLVGGDMEAIAFGRPYDHPLDWRRRVDVEAESVVASLSAAYDRALEGELAHRTEAVRGRLRSVARWVPVHSYRLPSSLPALAAAGQIVLVDPALKPLRVELFEMNDSEPAATLRIYRHDGWFQVEHVSGRRVGWSASDEALFDRAIEDPAIHTLDDLVALISVERGDAAHGV